MTESCLPVPMPLEFFLEKGSRRYLEPGQQHWLCAYRNLGVAKIAVLDVLLDGLKLGPERARPTFHMPRCAGSASGVRPSRRKLLGDDSRFSGQEVPTDWAGAVLFRIVILFFDIKNIFRAGGDNG